jgi:hypothetical protein
VSNFYFDVGCDASFLEVSIAADFGIQDLKLNKREFDSPILRARRARKIGLLGEWRVAPLSQKPVRRIHINKYIATIKYKTPKGVLRPLGAQHTLWSFKIHVSNDGATVWFRVDGF